MIFISTGHYPARPGVRLGPLNEHDIVADMVAQLCDFFQPIEIVPVGTITSKVNWINHHAHDDDLLVELHLDSVVGWDSQVPHGPCLPGQYETQPHGCSCWHYRFSARSEAAAAVIQNRLALTWRKILGNQYHGRGVRSSAGLAMLRRTRCRAVLVEIEFIWNAAAVLLYREQIADALVAGIRDAH